MTTQRGLLSTTLMALALATTALPMIASAFDSANAAGYAKQRHGMRAHTAQKRRYSRVRRHRARTVNRGRFQRRTERRLNRRAIRRTERRATMPRRIVRPKPRPFARPAVTMPKSVVTPRPRPFARPNVTTPKTVITPRPRPFARPAVTMPKTVVTPRPRPFSRPAVTTPQTVVGGNGQIDPTTGRINQRQQAAKQAQYQQCARFSLRVHQGCYSQAQGDPQKQKSCRTHYQGNLVRCQGLL